MGVLSAALTGVGVTILAEAGDKTFFVCALLAARGEKMKVFIASYAALAVQTVFCIAVAVLFWSKARELQNQKWRWDLIIGGATLLIFGILNVRESIATATFEEDQDMRALDEMINSLPEDPIYGDENLLLRSMPTNAGDVLDTMANNHRSSIKQEYVSKDVYVKMDHGRLSTEDTFGKEALMSRRGSLESNRDARQLKALSEAATLIQEREFKHPMYQAFGAVFAAELGDRSMFSTIALATTENPWGIAIGVLIGHFIVTLVAVSCASMMCRYVSQKTMILLAGCLFCLFGSTSLWEAYQISLTF